MKKNKRLLYTLENVPEKYLEEALEENARQHKILWHPFFAAAACIAVIAAVPFLIHNASQNTENNPANRIRQGHIDYSEFNWSSCLNEGEAAPDMNYYYLSARSTDEYGESLSLYKIENGYFCINFLKDKNFEKQINDEIKNISDQMLAQKDSYENFDIYPPAEDGDYYDSPFNTGGLTIKPSVQNGYFEVYIGLASNDKFKIEYLTADVLRYDLVTQKKIESIDEYASDGLSMENILDKCGPLLKSYYRTDDKMLFGSFMENSSDFDRRLSGFSYLVRKNEDGSLTAVQTMRLKISNYLDPYKERDFSNVIDEDIFMCNKDKYFNITNEDVRAQITLDGKSADYWLCGPSRFYTEAQIMEINDTYSEYYKTAFKYLADNHSDESNFSLERFSLNNKDFRKDLIIISNPYTVYIDSETLEVLSCFEVNFNAEGQEYVIGEISKQLQNSELNAKFDYSSMIFYFNHYSEESPECCNIVTYYDELAINLEVPFSMMNSRYFDSEKYTEY